MGFTLGIDLGTTFTAAAIWRDGVAEAMPLGRESCSIASVVFLRDNARVVVGDRAELEGRSEPARLARDFKRRFGDSIPILLDHTPVPVEQLVAVILRYVVAEVSRRMQAEPLAIAVACPAAWGAFKVELLRQALHTAGLSNASLVAEPLAAAAHYASVSSVQPGAVIVVYDLGGGSFDVTVVRRTIVGFDIIGRPQAIDQLGGIDFDEVVFRYVRRAVPEAIERLDTRDPLTRAALANLRRQFVAAKESLSTASETTIPIELPNLTTQLRLSRVEFEDMIRAAVRETVETTKRAIALAGITPAEVSSILLLGGSSRIPLVAEMLRVEIDRPLVSDLDRDLTIALGAARVAAVGVPSTAVVDLNAGAGMAADAEIDAGVDLMPATAERADLVPATTVNASGEPLAPPSVLPPPIQPPPIQPPPIQPPLETTPADARTRKTARVGGSAMGPPSNQMPSSVWRNPRVLGASLALLVIVVIAVAVSLSNDDTAAPLITTPAEPAASSPATSPAAVPVTSAGGPATTLAQVAASSVPAATVTTALGPADGLTCGASGRCAGITQIDFDGTRFTVHYAVWNVDPLVSQDAAFHLHFFYDTVPFDEAGAPATGPWSDWGRDADAGTYIFDGFTTDNAIEFDGGGATQICVAVADRQHVIEPDTVSCFDIGFQLSG